VSGAARGAGPGPVLFLMGPTGTGKTELAVRLVEHGPFAIVSVDSAMIYRGLDIGTAKPGPEVLARAPHRLIDIRDPAESYSAAEFRRDALREIAAIGARGRIPLLVGGTGLYFRALDRGLAPLPPADPDLRARLRAQAEQLGAAAMHARLQALDPDSAARIHPNDPQRVQRALEVHALTGRPLSAHLRASRHGALPHRVVRVVLAPAARSSLHRDLALRFQAMLDAGLVEEVGALRARGDLGPAHPAVRVTGYRQVWDFLAGQVGHEEMCRRAVAATRQLAKRQLTWLRREAGCTWLEAHAPDLVERVLALLRPELS